MSCPVVIATHYVFLPLKDHWCSREAAIFESTNAVLSSTNFLYLVIALVSLNLSRN